MRKVSRIRIINISLWGLLIGLCIHDGFIAQNDHSFSQGQVRGAVIFIAVFLFVIYPALTVFFTIKNGPGVNAIPRNLRHNYLALISYEWWKSK